MSAFPFLETKTDSRARSRSRSRERESDFRSREFDHRDRERFDDRRYDSSRDRDRDRGDRDRNPYPRHQDNRDRDRSRNLPLVPAPAKAQPVDENLAPIQDDPRIVDGRKMAKTRGGGRNTESFDPKSTLVRPDMRILVGPNRPVYGKKLKHDDVVVVCIFGVCVAYVLCTGCLNTSDGAQG